MAGNTHGAAGRSLNHLFHTRPLALVVIGGAVFLVLSLIVAILPALALREQSRAAMATMTAPDASVLRGRQVYLREGCGYCHSQFIRPTLIDLPYGRASRVEDFAGQVPPVPGTQRTGPDLSNVGNRQPSWMWQFMHLYNPRSMVPQSIMPSFPWYFDIVDTAEGGNSTYAMVLGPDFIPDGKVAIPTQEAIDLVAYLRSLKQE